MIADAYRQGSRIDGRALTINKKPNPEKEKIKKVTLLRYAGFGLACASFYAEFILSIANSDFILLAAGLLICAPCIAKAMR